MKQIKTIISVTLLLIITCTLPPIAQAQTTLPQVLTGVSKIVFLGDSITELGGKRNGYVWLVGRYLSTMYPEHSYDIIDAGVPGDTSTDMLKRFPQDVLAKKPQLLFINAGVNDVLHGYYGNKAGNGPGAVPLPDYTNNMAKMVSMARQAGIHVVILSATVLTENPQAIPNALISDYNAAAHDVARKNDSEFIDIQTPFLSRLWSERLQGATRGVLTTDGIHLNNEGNELMAMTILNGIGVSSESLSSAQFRAEQRWLIPSAATGGTLCALLIAFKLRRAYRKNRTIPKQRAA